MNRTQLACISLLLPVWALSSGCAHAESRPEIMKSESGGMELELSILSITPEGLKFEYSAVDVSSHRQGYVSGFGAKMEELDQESLMDEFGHGYGAHDYSYRNESCQISIRLTRDEVRIARVTEQGCGHLNLHENVFESALLRKQDRG
jgi:hypothetical protein